VSFSFKKEHGSGGQNFTNHKTAGSKVRAGAGLFFIGTGYASLMGIFIDIFSDFCHSC